MRFVQTTLIKKKHSSVVCCPSWISPEITYPVEVQQCYYSCYIIWNIWMIFLGGPWRCIIIMAMIFAAGGTFLVENPANSLIALHPRWVWFLECLRKYLVFVPRRSKHCVFFSLQDRAWNMFMMKTCFEQVINLLLLPLYIGPIPRYGR